MQLDHELFPTRLKGLSTVADLLPFVEHAIHSSLIRSDENTLHGRICAHFDGNQGNDSERVKTWFRSLGFDIQVIEQQCHATTHRESFRKYHIVMADA